jgi:hypothetical protein
MHSAKSTALLTKQFWTIFGLYMAPIPSADGEKINWINYKTEVRFVRFRLQTNNNTASVAIELSHPDLNIQTQQFEQLLLFKKQFQEIGGTDWRWQKMNKDEGDKVTSTVETSIEHVSLLNESHWPQIISFFKSNLISLDAFWCSYKFALQD